MTFSSDTSGPIDTAPPSALSPPSSAGSRGYAGRDRVLLYTRGMDLNSEESVALALESIREAGQDAGPAEVMDSMFAILREHGHSPLLRDAEGSLITCTPPMNRRTVVATDMEQFSLTAVIGKLLESLVPRRFKKSRESR